MLLWMMEMVVRVFWIMDIDLLSIKQRMLFGFQQIEAGEADMEVNIILRVLRVLYTNFLTIGKQMFLDWLVSTVSRMSRVVYTNFFTIRQSMFLWYR